MENNTDATKMEACPLNMDAEWCPFVNERADKAEQSRQKKVSWAEQQKAKRLAERRARRFMSAFALAVALIVAGAIGLNYVDGFPVWLAAAVAMGGMTIYSFVVGWLFGHRARQ